MIAAVPDARREIAVDAAVIGGGLAGLATAIHLARNDIRVVCIEPRRWPRPAVGESLEFSAPRLLADLGVDLDCSDDSAHLYPKTSVMIHGDETTFNVWPPSWFSRPPIWCSCTAYHTDRTKLDHQIAGIAVEHGVEILEERVTHIDHDYDTIKELVTDHGTRVTAEWYVDATGHSSRLLGRTLGLEVETLGLPRMAYWGRFDVPPLGHATCLYFFDDQADDLAWAWEIPLNANELSIGAVMSAPKLARLRHQGLRPSDIFGFQLRQNPRLASIINKQPAVPLHATSYTPYRHRPTIGPNWLLVGDASAMVDPLTSNGVTFALRGAEQAARTVSRALDQHSDGRRLAWAYKNTVPATATTLGHAIESFLYKPSVRQRLGIRWAVNLYAATGVITNSLYARIGQTSVTRSAATAGMLAAARTWTGVGATLAGMFRPRRDTSASRDIDLRRPVASTPSISFRNFVDPRLATAERPLAR